jgi:hypothetical protein
MKIKKKYEKKYNCVYNVLRLQTVDSPISKRQTGMPYYTIKHKMTSDTKCHFHKNDTINTINTDIKYTIFHTNKTKHT